jgi:hypothetical protein
VKSSKIIGLSQFPFSDIVHKLFPAHRNKIFDEFVKFKNNDANVATLSIAAAEADSQYDYGYLFTWNKQNGRTEQMHAHFYHPSNEILFTWDDERDQKLQLRRPGNLPFDNEAFDWVFCDAVIEHVGNADRQYLLLKELMRVARKGIFVTTSNRWHPFEFYTALPFLHWLPSSLWKGSLRFLGKKTWTRESMLNLLDAKALQGFVNKLPQKPQCSIGHVRVMGLKAYFFLQIKKESAFNKADAYATYPG